MRTPSCLLFPISIFLVAMSGASCKSEKDHLLDLMDRNADTRIRAVEMLRKTDSRAGRSALVRALNDGEIKVRMAAVQSLGSVLERSKDRNIVLEMKDSALAVVNFDLDIRMRAETVKTIGPFADQKMLEKLLEHVEREAAPVVRFEIMTLMGKRKYAPALPVCLKTLLSDPAIDVKKSAIWALGEIGNSQDATKALEGIAENRRWVDLWPAANEALGKLGKR